VDAGGQPPSQSWVDPRIEIRPSGIEGAGEFASADIALGEVVKRLGGRLIDDAELQAITASGERYSALRSGDDTHLLMAWDDPASRGNHSCDPNTWMDGTFNVVARRAIRAGEEVTIDYALLTATPEWSMPCTCGTTVCRGTVTGEDYRSAELRERYRGHFVPWIEAQAE